MTEDKITLYQFTDTHLFSDPTDALCGQKTEESLDVVLKEALSNGWPPDVVMVTGDISQDKTEESYHRFNNKFKSLNVPVLCLPGNHDSPEVMSSVLNADPVKVGRKEDWGNWRFVMLSSVIPNSNGGEIHPSELEFLESSLKAEPDKHFLVSMHHSPVSIDSNWIDSMSINNADAFFRVIDRHSNIRAILWGHIHQDYEGERKGVKLMATPSTCVQFKPKSHQFGFDKEYPGYRWIQLFSDGRIKTGINRVKKFNSTVDLNSTGY